MSLLERANGYNVTMHHNCEVYVRTVVSCHVCKLHPNYYSIVGANGETSECMHAGFNVIPACLQFADRCRVPLDLT